MPPHRPEVRAKDIRDSIPEFFGQEDADRAGNDLCELIDEMMGKDPEAIEREVEEEVEWQMAGEAVQVNPKKAGHMAEPGAVDVLMDLAKALQGLRKQRADDITQENARKFETYEERAFRKVYDANRHSVAVSERRKRLRKVFKETLGGFTDWDRRSDAG